MIYVQLASGHDPALVANAKRATAENTSSNTESLTGSGSESGESSTIELLHRRRIELHRIELRRVGRHHLPVMSAAPEIIEEFDCFGSRCAALVIGPGDAGSAQDAASLARRALLSWHSRFSRFLPTSELSQLNGDARREVPVRSLMARFAQAVHTAGSITGGLVDATLPNDVQRAGYADDLGAPVPLQRALALADARRPAGGSTRADWRQIEVDLDAGTITRPPGVMLDSGGLAKACSRTCSARSSPAIAASPSTAPATC